MTTFKQRAILSFIKGYIERRECSPTVREIAEYLGIGYNAARKRLIVMQRKGIIDWEYGSPRSIHILE